MIIARQKKNENIVEYILYMFQIENTLRALDFDPEKIRINLVDQYDLDHAQKAEIQNWYHQLAGMMREEQITQKGHLQFLRNTINDLYGVHIIILNSKKDQSYEQVFRQAQPDIELLRKKTGNPGAHDVETGIDGIYGFLLLQIRKEKVTDATKAAIKNITEWLYLLALRYRQIEAGEREI